MDLDNNKTDSFDRKVVYNTKKNHPKVLDAYFFTLLKQSLNHQTETDLLHFFKNRMT